jgi:K+-sensing histidine kinase KdpD
MVSRRERTLETLHTAATDIQACDSIESACRRTAEAAAEVLEFEMCSVLVHEDGWLEPVALSERAPPDGARRVRADEGLAGKTFQTGEAYVIDEVSPDDDTEPAKDTYRSGISVPIGEVGVFQAVSAEPEAFDESDVELAELLVAHTARTLDRLQFEAELRSRRSALQRQNERLEEFVDVVSHDLRSPLNVAAGRVELAQAECDSEHLDIAERAHHRMGTLIEDLLTLAREGRPIEELEPVDLGALGEDCWQTLETGSATVGFETDQTVCADRNRLRQLLENLLRNAVEHGGPGVSVTVGPLAGKQGFYVADDGPGIPPDTRGTVFEKGHSTVEDGTGFGLAIVEEIADTHGWTVTATESADGGARFEVSGVELAVASEEAC